MYISLKNRIDIKADIIPWIPHEIKNDNKSMFNTYIIFKVA